MNDLRIDVSHLPTYAFGHRSLMWWGVAALMAIEGTIFALLITMYLYLKSRALEWPPGFFAPMLLWGTVNTAVLILSAVPNHLAKRAAERQDLRGLRWWLGVSIGVALVFCGVRVLEFRTLNVWWDSNAYGSIVWTLLGFHTTHLITDVIDSLALETLLFTGPMDESHFVDAAENAIYWDFVVIAWVPLYALIYLAPRLA
ncbi:MAG TPA: cytochrome c oxidase subunit 3 [Luteitalea sp.]|nr:cytochrome c oxidase subunit 3 [Luteitalea sp.]